ncbi:hypothetical protein RZR81_02030 [Proteus mirabilis]|uniref:hypothetical protein n=1 Tax=Proteus mirabilis TaxID=584 RepID=UPI0025769630|nr:hypothetical protein [Proteus mirabilis]MDM3803329.1 hypothetical protein [Proteus mirabilis]HCS1002228.1 hypothetical protein [Proteus mirabilis]
MIESTATTAINHEDFTSVFNALIEHLFLRNRGGGERPKLSDEKIKRATWLASLGSSGNENDKSIASALGHYFIYMIKIMSCILKLAMYYNREPVILFQPSI